MVHSRPVAGQGLGGSGFAVTQRPEHIGKRKNVSYGEDGSASARKGIKQLELIGIDVIPARHAHHAENELRKKGQVETDEDRDGRNPGRKFGVKAPTDFWPPKMQPSEVGHDHPANHDVMEMRDDEVGVGEVYIDRQCCHIEASKAAYREEPDETQAHRASVCQS